jgi:predicted nucleic acid-binding protein
VIYCDTSSLLKVLVPESESVAVESFLATRQAVIVSSWTLVETEAHLNSLRAGGLVTESRHARIIGYAHAVFSRAPYQSRSLNGSVFASALAQQRRMPVPHVRSADRLHLAAMEELGVMELLSHDAKQVAAAKALGFVCFTPV